MKTLVNVKVCDEKFSRSHSLKNHNKRNICKKTNKNKIHDDADSYNVIC